MFAHNGHVEHFPDLNPEVKRKVLGQTDSELFFAYLVEHLRNKFPQRPTNEELFTEIKAICDKFAEYGILNFVLSNGSLMFAHCSTNLYWITRCAKENSLVRRVDDGGVINLSRYANSDDLVTIICTIPLTDEK